MSTRSIRILLVDDHAVVRQGFRMILAAQADMEIVGEAGNGREAIAKAAELHPDVVVMDVAMPELNGIEATRRLAETSPQTRVLALSMHKDSVYVREILRAGARGYLLKDSIDVDFLTAVRAVALRSPVVSPEPAPRSKSRSKYGRWLAVSAVAAAAAWIIWLSPAMRPGTPPALPGSPEVAELWRESAEPGWAAAESPADDEPHTEPDTAPDWMLAAVSLDAAGVGEPEVLEN